MINKLADLVTGKQIAVWLLLFFLVGYFIYKEWPEFRSRISRGAVKEHTDEVNEKTINGRLGTIESEVKQINEKLDRDYKRLNKMEAQIGNTINVQANTSDELTIIIEALLGALGGLQELGANGPTKEAESKIQDYLNKKAHKGAQV
jgi:hypothetical protein